MPYHLLVMKQVERLIDDPLIIGFTWLVIIDIISGIVKGLRGKITPDRTNSTKGIYGLCKHMLILTMVLTIYPYLITLNFDSIAQVMVLAFAYQYLVSIIENLNQMNIDVAWLKPILDTLAEKLNLAKAQDDYNGHDYNPITGAYRKPITNSTPTPDSSGQKQADSVQPGSVTAVDPSKEAK
ncbi:phage holin family protein [uncultured Lentilactobacillus sp.]|uniref:phage holin family protein n=1 Tax=uncultured Lentilactobacillus sp. TaxID=2805375 RepID=UPI0025946FF7|nr:phage holin family protein [uncultured Lentilactobacillus sp.]